MEKRIINSYNYSVWAWLADNTFEIDVFHFVYEYTNDITQEKLVYKYHKTLTVDKDTFYRLCVKLGVKSLEMRSFGLCGESVQRKRY